MSAPPASDVPSLFHGWQAIASVVLALPAHQPLEVERRAVPHPRACGFYASTGLDRRCLHHYRRALPDGKGLHVHVFRTHYLVHWDRVDPSVSVLRHFWHDVTRALARSARRVRMEAVHFAGLRSKEPAELTELAPAGSAPAPRIA
jgi:hypothetical protein